MISGTAFVFDKYQNLVLQPQPVKFDLNVNGQNVSRTETIERRRRLHQAGLVEEGRPGAVRRLQRERFGPTRGAAGRIRSVQHPHDVPSPTRTGILVQTDPIRDCSGNPVPDGTIVTFTSTDANGKSTVDARIKQRHRTSATAGLERCHYLGSIGRCGRK